MKRNICMITVLIAFSMLLIIAAKAIRRTK